MASIPLLLLSVFFALLGSGCGGAPRVADRASESVRYGVTANIRGFDPVKAGDVDSAVAISRIYEGLLQYSYLARPYRVEPNLAEALPDISPDGLVYTFKIRKGIYYQDDACFPGGKGRELEAADFVYSIKRLVDAKNSSTGSWTVNDKIAGLAAFVEASRSDVPTDYSMKIEGLDAPDRYTFRIKLVEPYPQLLWVLTMQYAFAVPREAVEYYGDKFIYHPVGTGPYVLSKWRRNYSVEYVRNQKWKETGRIEKYPSDCEPSDREQGLLDDAGKHLPFIDRLVDYVVTDASTQWLMFVRGDIESSGISRDNWQAVLTEQFGLSSGLSRMKIRLFTAPTLDVYYLGFNMDDPVVGTNKKLRQALSCAFNTEDWVKFYNQRIVRARGPIPPGVAGYGDSASPYPFDLEKAARLLDEAGYPGGVDKVTGKRLQLTIDVGSASSPEFRASQELIAGFLGKIGVTIKTQYNNWPTFLAKMERRQCQMYSLGWVADYPDAQNFLQLFYGPNSSPNPNHSNYVNPEFDRLYDEVKSMVDCPERTALYRKMADMVIEDCPWIFMHHPTSYGLHHSWVGNYKPHDFPYGMEKYRKVNAQLRTEWKREFGRSDWRE